MPLIAQIGADASNYNKVMAGLGPTAQGASNEVSQALGQAARQTDALGGSAMSASMRFQTMRSGISAARDGVLAFSVGGQAAERSLLAMGHHLTSLVNETGSATGALKALGASLIGPGGIILAISLAAEIWSKYRDRQSEATQKQDEFTKALNEGIQSSATELAHVTALYGATQNENLSRADRLTAVRELQKEYPTYFGGMTQEAILAGKAAGAYDRLTNSIINSAVAKAGEASLSESLKPLIEIQSKLIAQQYELDKGFKQTGKSAEQATSTKGFSKVTSTLQSKPIMQTGFVQDQKTNDLETLNKYKNDIQDKIKSNAAAIQGLLEQFGVSALLKKSETGDKPKEAITGYDLLQKKIADLKSELNDAAANGESNDVIGRLGMELADAEQKLKSLDDTVKKSQTMAFLHGGDSFNIDDPLKSQIPQEERQIQVGQTEAPAPDFENQIQKLKDLAAAKSLARAEGNLLKNETKDEAQSLREVTNILGNGLTSAFQKALSGTESFGQAFGQFIIQLIERLIAAIAAAAILAALLSFTGLGAVTGAASGAGAFATNLATGLSSIKLADGGITTGPTHALIGEGREREAVMPLSKLKNFVNTNQGGMEHGQIVGVLRGPDILLQYQRAQLQKNRIG